MAKLRISYETHMRDEFGRFVSVYNAAEEAAVSESTAELLELAQANAPRRSGELAGSGTAASFGKSGIVGFTSDHAAPQEYGARPHAIPHAFGRDFIAHHPGNPATHFLARAVEAMKERFVRRITNAFPG